MATRKVAKAVNAGHLDFDAALTKEQMGEMERAYGADANGISRRIALALLTQSKAELVKCLQADTDASDTFMTVLENLHGYIEQLDAIREVMNAARARLIIALQAACGETKATA